MVGQHSRVKHHCIRLPVHQGGVDLLDAIPFQGLNFPFLQKLGRRTLFGGSYGMAG